LGEVVDDITKIGSTMFKADRAHELVVALNNRIEAVRKKVALTKVRPRVVCLEWIDPLIVAGHWISEMIEIAGGVDCIGDKERVSFQIGWKELVKQRPEVVVVSPCGFTVQRGLAEMNLLTSKKEWRGLPACQNERVFVTDSSSYFSRSGPRLVDGLEMLAEMIHPELFVGMVPQASAVRMYGSDFR